MQFQHFKRRFFLKCRSINFYINSTRVTRLFSRNKSSFCGSEIENPLPALVQLSCRSDLSLETNSSIVTNEVYDYTGSRN